MVESSTYYTKKEEKIAKKFKIVLAENSICRKQLKSQERTGKTSRNKNNKAKKKSWTVRPRRCKRKDKKNEKRQDKKRKQGK